VKQLVTYRSNNISDGLNGSNLNSVLGRIFVMNTCFDACFRFKDIDRATNAKFTLEQKQRDEAKDRKEKGVKWETMVINTE
jgi:hypothetical protein